MQLRYKVVMLAVVPLVLAAGLLAFVVKREGTALADDQVARVEKVLIDAKRAELKHLVALAHEAIRGLENSKDDKQSTDEALKLLERLSFGADDYFYVYNLHGKCLMHPRQPELVGQELLNFTDDTGKPVIRRLIEATADPDGGFVEYRWKRPSQQEWRPKLGYVVGLPSWGWMLGTGIYLDDVDDIKHQIRTSSSAAIGDTMLFIALIAMLAVLVVGTLGVALNVSQQRLADSKLQRLTWEVVAAQAAERARVSRYLHDEAVQDLIAVKCVLETALLELKSDPPHGKLAETLEQGLAGLTKGVDEIRRLSRDLRPPLQSDGLPALLEQLGAAFSKRTGVVATVDAPAVRQPLSAEAATALFRVTQQALDNVERHARASRVVIQLAARSRRRSGTDLTVSDNGCGFNVAAVEGRPGGGIGLLNMRERIEALGGRLAIRSGPQGTEIEAFLPDDASTESET